MPQSLGDGIQENWTLNGKRLQELCWERGWDWGELARQSGVSRGTLYQWQKQKTAKPRLATLYKLAEVLEVEARQLLLCAEDQLPTLSCSEPPVSLSAEPHRLPWEETVADVHEPGCGVTACLFDRQTNWSVQETCERHPDLFRDWRATEWDELYSSFGTGGELNEAGVIRQAELINQKRETMYQLQVILETHLADAAERIIRSLYESVHLQTVEATNPDQT